MPTSVSIPRDSQAKLQHILRVSARIFADQGFEATSIRDISRATEVSLSGLYYYFESKQHLLYLIQSTTFKVVLDNLRSQLQGAFASSSSTTWSTSSRIPTK